jgi:hypothetical protein
MLGASTLTTSELGIFLQQRSVQLLPEELSQLQMLLGYYQARQRAKSTPSLSQLRDFLQKQVRDWSPQEKQMVQKMFQTVTSKIKARCSSNILSISPNFARSSPFIELGMPHTVGKTIYLGDSFFDGEGGEETLAHEFFHVVSRNNVSRMEKAYAQLGFEILPAALSPAPDGITNPDVELRKAAVRVKLNASGEMVRVVPFLRLEGENPTPSLSHMKPRLAVLDANNGLQRGVVGVDETDIVQRLSLSNWYSHPDFYPEEILANCFGLWLSGSGTCSSQAAAVVEQLCSGS